VAASPLRFSATNTLFQPFYDGRAKFLPFLIAFPLSQLHFLCSGGNSRPVAFKAVTACKQHRELLKAIAQALIICVAMAMVTLISTLAIRFISERNFNQQKIVAFTAHAVESFDKLLLPLEHKRDVVCRSLGHLAPAPICIAQTGRQFADRAFIGLVKTVYCTARVFLVIGMSHPSTPARITVDKASHGSFHRSVAFKNSPVMMWYPTATDGQSGITRLLISIY
jgi:hypothetical protein